MPKEDDIKNSNDLSIKDNSIEKNIKPSDQKWVEEKLNTWKGYLKYESVFVLIMFLELFWTRLDTIIASIWFNPLEIATQSSFGNIVMIMDCCAYGLSIATASMISKFIVQKKN